MIYLISARPYAPHLDNDEVDWTTVAFENYADYREVLTQVEEGEAEDEMAPHVAFEAIEVLTAADAIAELTRAGVLRVLSL